MGGHRISVVLAIGASALALALITSCSAPVAPTATPSRMMGSRSQGPGASTPQTAAPSGGDTSAYASSGQRIWLTGVGVGGADIARSAPGVSQGALMMGGGGCGSCHGADGKGGAIRMMRGPTINAPDVTYTALTKAGFTDTTIRQAIVKGTDEKGKPLDRAMPKWQMSSADLDAVIAYLKVLAAR